MINWDDFWWACLSDEELAEFEQQLADEVEWLQQSRRVEQQLTGQEP